MKVALFLVGLARDHFKSEADDARKIEVRRREEAERQAEEFPDDDKHEWTFEQWELYCEMREELYYAIAAATWTGVAYRHLDKLYAAIEEML